MQIIVNYLIGAMTLKTFLINYFSPFYVVARCFFLFLAAAAWFVLPYFVPSISGWNADLCLYVSRGIALALVLNAIRPWRIGASYNDIKNGLDNIQNRMK